MSMLPICGIIQLPLRSFDPNNDSEFENLLKLIRDYVSEDCWAFIINDEALFNTYNNESKTYTAILNEKMIRDKIVEDIYGILSEISYRNINTKIEIYMFAAPASYKLIIQYKANLHKYIVYRLNSKAYIDQIGEDEL